MLSALINASFFFHRLGPSEWLSRLPSVPLTRPSVDVGLVVGLEDTAVLDDYFSRFMRPDSQGGYPGSLVKNVSPPDWTQVGPQEVAK